MSIFNITYITPVGAFVNATAAAQDSDRRAADRHDRHFQSGVPSQVRALRPADRALRAMATEEAARPTRVRTDHVSVPWRASIACVTILAVVGIVMF